MKPLLLCVGMEPGRLMRIAMIASSLGAAVKEVRPDQGGQTLEALCGLTKENPAAPKQAVPGEMAVLAFFPDGLLDALLAAFRKNGMDRPRLLAVLTPTNRKWACAGLYRELQKEAAAMKANN